jgi:hypothetical protein
MKQRVIKITFEVPSARATEFAKAIDKVLTQLPRTAPDTVVVKESEVSARFDVRYISPMLWNRTLTHLGLINAKETQRVILIDEKRVVRENL